jgi:TIR domain
MLGLERNCAERGDLRVRVFLSWSGEQSKWVAESLRNWLPNVLQAIDPWMSSQDIAKGSLWSEEMSDQLKQIKAGIVCVTPDNQEAPWINFEAGALSKTVAQTLVCPYLIGLKATDLKPPLASFQAAEGSESDTLKMIMTLNRALGEHALSVANVERTFAKWWPDLQKDLEKAASIRPSARSARPDREILEEILVLARDLSQVWRNTLEQTERTAEQIVRERLRRTLFEPPPPSSSREATSGALGLPIIQRDPNKGKLYRRPKSND